MEGLGGLRNAEAAGQDCSARCDLRWPTGAHTASCNVLNHRPIESCLAELHSRGAMI